jgi:outer membrane protein OmpA-like peptidoglycan-associated protein
VGVGWLTYVENKPSAAASRDDDKLIPEWSQSGDNQILLLGLLVVLIMAFSWGCSKVTGGDDLADSVVGQFGLEVGDGSASPDSADPFSAAVPKTSVQATETTLAVGDLQGAMDEFSLTGTIDGDRAILTGYVGSAAESAAAEVAATKVPGINSVDNRLVIIEPLAQAALEAAGAREVQNTSASGTRVTAVGYVDNEAQRVAALAAVSGVDGVSGAVGDELIVLDGDIQAGLDAAGSGGIDLSVVDGVVILSGEVPDEAARTAALNAAAVPGVVEVIDQLTIPAPPEPTAPDGTDTRDQLNALFEANPIQFNTGSADIKAESFTILDQAVELLTNTNAELQVQGYTDTTGNPANNQQLSEDRAAAVRDYLISKGIGSDQLTARGYGPTDEFGAGDTAGALAQNRRVRFELA